MRPCSYVCNRETAKHWGSSSVVIRDPFVRWGGRFYEIAPKPRISFTMFFSLSRIRARFSILRKDRRVPGPLEWRTTGETGQCGSRKVSHVSRLVDKRPRPVAWRLFGRPQTCAPLPKPFNLRGKTQLGSSRLSGFRRSSLFSFLCVFSSPVLGLPSAVRLP